MFVINQCNLNKNITLQCGKSCTAKLYRHTILNKESQVIDSPASTFEGLRYKEIAEYGKQLQSI